MDHYQTLGIQRNAAPDEIQRAYRRLASKHHPDMNPDDPNGARERFKQVALAYEILSDPSKKVRYDAFGDAGARTVPPKPAKPKPKTKEDFERERADERRKQAQLFSQRELDAIQCSFFGGSGTGRNVLVQLKLTPAEMKSGCTKMVKYKKRGLCKRCIGDGLSSKPCPLCHGQRPEIGWCQRCHGNGSLDEKCPVCKGDGVAAWIIDEVKVMVSPNSQVGHTINVLGEGEAAPFKAPGNVRVVLI